MSLICPNGHPSEAADFCDTCGAKIDPAAQPTPTAPTSGPAGAQGPAASASACPHCGVDNLPGSLFCEACGYDFTTGAMPRGAEADPAGGSSLDLFGETPSGATPSPAPTPAATPAEAPAPESAPSPPPAPEAPGAPEVTSPPAAPATTSAPTAPVAKSGIPPRIAMEWVAEVWIDPDWYAGQETDDPMPSPGLPVVVPLTVRSALIGRVSVSKNIHPDIDCTSDTGVSRSHAQLTTDGTRWFIEDLDSANGTFVGGAAQALPEDPIPVGPKRELEDDERIYVGAWTRIVVRRATEQEQAAAAGSTS